MSSSLTIIQDMANEYAHNVYTLSRDFPQHEIYGITSQLRRSALSVPLNIIEGFARQSIKTELHFLTIAYGSLKESLYLLDFVVKEGYVSSDDVASIIDTGNHVARLLWTKIQRYKTK